MHQSHFFAMIDSLECPTCGSNSYCNEHTNGECECHFGHVKHEGTNDCVLGKVSLKIKTGLFTLNVPGTGTLECVELICHLKSLHVKQI